MTATLIDALRVLYPDAVPGIDYQIDATDREQITDWHLTSTQPTADEIAAGKRAATLVAAQARKIAALKAACNRAIVAGYQSDALGSPHVYPCSPRDQSNMQASIIGALIHAGEAGWTTGFPCVEPAHQGDAEWPKKQHTAAQVKQAGDDGFVHVKTELYRCDQLVAQVRAITLDDDDPIAAVAAIQWPAAGA